MTNSSPLHRLPRGLVVDDDKVLANALKRKLSKAGFSIVVCNDGDKALDAIERCPFAFILLDLGLPSVDGLQILRRIPETTNAETPAFVLTGCPEKCDDATQAGAKRCFVKIRCDLNDVVSGIQDTVLSDI